MQIFSDRNDPKRRFCGFLANDFGESRRNLVILHPN
jgi:hypothetical protein